MAINNILVERETYEKNGKTYFSYFIKGKIRGKEVKIGVIPPDKGGYTVLDIVFGNAMAAELLIKPFEIKDDATGKVISGNTYAVVGLFLMMKTAKSMSAQSSLHAHLTSRFLICLSRRWYKRWEKLESIL